MDSNYKVINSIKLKLEHNSYRLENEQNFNLLIELITYHKNTYNAILNSRHTLNENSKYGKYKYLLSWITKTVIKLNNPEYTLKTKIYWIINDIRDFEKCANAACSETTEHRNIIDLVKGYGHHKGVQLFHCSKRCARFSSDTRSKIENTCIEKYGHKHHLQNESVKLKLANTMISRYGVKCAYQKPDVVKKARRTTIEKYGVEFPFQNKEILNYARNRLFEKYGVYCISQIPGYYENVIVPSNLKKYGMRNPISMKFVQDKRQNTCMKKYGCANVMQNRNIRIKQQVSSDGYQYDGNTFDSSWELVVYLIEKHNGSDITYNPNISFKYECNNKQSTYFPDFQINGVLVEVKGDQFFKPDGTMYCPYRHNWQSDDDYECLCRKFEAKHQCMIANGIKILRSKEINEYFKLLNESKQCAQIYSNVLNRKNNK